MDTVWTILKHLPLPLLFLLHFQSTNCFASYEVSRTLVKALLIPTSHMLEIRISRQLFKRIIEGKLLRYIPNKTFPYKNLIH